MTARPGNPARGAGRLRRHAVLAGVALVFAVIGATIGWWRWQVSAPAQDAARLLWSASLNDPSGQPVALERFQGQPLVVNFWATWCAPCIKEMPELSRVHDEFAPRGIRMLGIAIDSPTPVREFASRQPVSYPLVVGGLSGTELVRQFGNESGALPFTVLLAADGRIVWRHLGIVDVQMLRDQLARIHTR